MSSFLRLHQKNLHIHFVKNGTQGSIDSNKDTPKMKDVLYDQGNIDAPRSRLIINPDYVSSLDDSDGTKQYDEWQRKRIWIFS